ncbi:hypothetical protein Hanom_Chr03g00206411 [Helianthus anomalus]
MGYGGAWVGGMSLVLAIESPPCHLTSPTPGFKLTPMGPRPIPHGLSIGDHSLFFVLYMIKD